MVSKRRPGARRLPFYQICLRFRGDPSWDAVNTKTPDHPPRALPEPPE